MSHVTKQKKETGRTQKRKGTLEKGRTQSVSAEGMSTVELQNSLSNTKTRNLLHDAIRTSYAFTVPEWLKYASESARLPIPIRESRRFRVGLDEEYFPGQIVKMESTEYIFAQAPVKKSARMIWKAAQQLFFHDKSPNLRIPSSSKKALERIRLMVCLCHDEQMTTDDDDTKCFTWFPTEPDQSIEIEQQKKGTYTVVCKSREGLSMGAIKYELELTDSETVVDKNSDDPNAANEKIQKIVLYHMNTWTGLKPDSGNALEKAHDIAIFSREVKKHELDVLRKSMENYVPPVLIQSFDGINRSATLWVALMLLRDCEMRECFDVPGLMKSIMKMRIGSLSTYFQFCFCMAVCLNIGKDTKWCENDCISALTDLTNKFGERKVDENGYLLAH